jgi:phage terminase large subunit-like protein
MRLADEVAEADARDWSKTARPEQIPPPGYRIWIYMAGRGAGKSRSASQEIAKIAKENPGCVIAVVARKDLHLETICFGGESGLCAVIPPEEIERYYTTRGDVHLVLKNGSVIRGFSSEKPDNIAGENLTAWWLDEYGLFTPSNAVAVMWQLKMATRKKGTAPKGVITTTPRQVKHMRDLVEEASNDPRVVLVRGKTNDNRANLSEEFIRDIHEEYAGTRLGRQELDGELLEDVPGALFNGDMIAAARADCPDPLPTSFDRVIVGFDPSGGGTDATGIVVGGQIGPHIYALADYTINDTPGARFEAGCRAAFDYGASLILYESAYGADLNAYGLQEAWRNLTARGLVEGDPPKIKPTTLRGDKAKRAEPVVALYEQGGRIFHAADLDQLEDEMTTWDPSDAKAPSPNRIDAWTYVVRHLTDKPRNSKAPQVPKGSREGAARGGLAITRARINR